MNKKNNTAFEVVDGCIQEGRKQYLAGEQFTPATNGYALELLKAGIIRPAAGKELPKRFADVLEPEPEPEPQPELPEGGEGETDQQGEASTGEEDGDAEDSPEQE